MTMNRQGAESGAVRRVEPASWSRSALASAALGILGLVATFVPYVVLRARLPAEVPDHFGVNGQPDGSLPPAAALGVALAESLLVTLVFFLVIWRTSRSAPLAAQARGRAAPPLLVLQGVLVVGILPTLWGLVFASAAGELVLTGPRLGLLLALVGIVPAAVLILVFVRLWRPPALAPLSPSSEATETPVFLGVGRPVELQCSSCGQRFRLAGVPLLAPHMGVGGARSLYVRCPRCGERGWDELVGVAAA